MGLKDKAYQGISQIWQVEIAGQEIDFDRVVDISDLRSVSNYPVVDNFSAGECTITLIDEAGDFSPENASNFFVDNSEDQKGVNAPVAIKFAYEGDTPEAIFAGVVISVRQDSTEGIAHIVCTDKSTSIANDLVENFGIHRRFRINEETTAVVERALGEGRHRANAVYPVLKAFLPASDGSQVLHHSLTKVGTFKRPLSTAGDLNPDNFTTTNLDVQTEGGHVDIDAAALATFPQLEIRSPYRHQTIERFLNELLAHYDNPAKQVDLIDFDVEEHLSSNGRPGYETTGASGRMYDVSGAWGYYCSDLLFVDGAYWFLMTVAEGSSHRSVLLRYSITNHDWEIQHTFAAGERAYKMINDGTIFYVLVTSGGGEGTYDSLNVTSRVKIISISGSLSATIVASNATYKPTLANYYHFGSGIEFSTPSGLQFQVPDSRKGLQFYNNRLYYTYTKGTNEIGVIGVGRSTPEFSYVHDGNDNQGMCAWHINSNGRLVGDVSWRDRRNSEAKLFTTVVS